MTEPSAAALVAALLGIPDQLDRIERAATTAQQLTFTEAPTHPAAEVALVPKSWTVQLDGVGIGTLHYRPYSPQWHAIWWVGEEQQSGRFTDRDAAIAVMVKDHRAEVTA